MLNAYPTRSRREPMVLVFGADDNYAMSLGVAIHSVLVHLEPGCSLRLYVIDGGISDLNRQRLRRVVDVDHIDLHLEWITPDLGLINDLKVSGHITPAAYSCLLVPDVVDKGFAKGIYLDCDLQVESNLANLWQENLGGHALLAVRDFLVPCVSSPGGVANYKTLGLRPEMPYFNSGVLLLDLERWRAEKISQKVFRYLREYREYVDFWDQGGLNAVLAGEWGVLDPKWNVASSIYSYERWPESAFKKEIGTVLHDLIRDPYIIHYIGPNKPWQVNCEHPSKTQWHRYVGGARWFSDIEDTRARENFAERSRKITTSLKLRVNKVTIAIPTYNRSQLLKPCLESVLGQDFSNFGVVVLDNASSDDTPVVVESLRDPRITYVRNETNIGLLANWNRALEISRSPYLTILPDDDVLLPGFIRSLVSALEKHPDVGFAAGLARYIDRNGRRMDLQDGGELGDGVLDGLEFLHAIVSGMGPRIHPATVMMRSSALGEVKHFKALHSKQLFDLNLYVRLAARFAMFFIRGEVAQVRLHPDQMKELEFDCLEGIEALALAAELTDAIAHLAQSERGKDTRYRKWLAQRLLDLNWKHSTSSRMIIPSLNLTLAERRAIEAQHFLSVIPTGETFILVDGSITMREFVAGRHALPFLERYGCYFGNPGDDEVAIGELERMARCGASFIVFGQEALWWFDHYRRFHTYLCETFRCVLEDDHVVVFDLRS